MARFDRHTIQRHTDALAEFLPDNPLFAAKNIGGTVMRNTVQGLALLFQGIENFVSAYMEEYDLLTTQKLIGEWESEVGIPGIFKETTSLTLQKRINQVQVMLLANGVKTNDDFIDIAILLGFTGLTIEKVAPYILDITHPNISGGLPPYNVPFTPSSVTTNLVNIFDFLKPVHVQMNFIGESGDTFPLCTFPATYAAGPYDFEETESGLPYIGLSRSNIAIGDACSFVSFSVDVVSAAAESIQYLISYNSIPDGNVPVNVSLYDPSGVLRDSVEGVQLNDTTPTVLQYDQPTDDLELGEWVVYVSHQGDDSISTYTIDCDFNVTS